MRVARTDDRLVIEDNPLGTWLFYFCFVAAGAVALYLSATAAPDLVTRIVGTVVGVGNVAGGVHLLRREPASRVEADATLGELRIRRWGLGGRREESYPLAAVRGVEIESTEHSEGGLVYRPRLCVGEAAFVPISYCWYQTEEKSQLVVTALHEFLRATAHGDYDAR